MKKLLLAGAMALASMSVAQAGVIYDNTNPHALTSCADIPFDAMPDSGCQTIGGSFTLTDSYLITSVTAFFVPAFSYAPAPTVELGLLNLGDNSIVSSVSDGGCNGFCQTSALNVVLGPGNYQIYASSNYYWGFNGMSDYVGIGSVSGELAGAPEPGTWSMIGLGVLGLGYRARFRRKP